MISDVSVPEAYSNPLDFARPICLTDELPAVNIVPLEPVSALCNNTCLNASVVVPEDTKPTSGEPNTLFTTTWLPTSNLVGNALFVSKSLALFTSKNVVPIFSNSYPLTYALPGPIPIASFVVEAVPPALVSAPSE